MAAGRRFKTVHQRRGRGEPGLIDGLVDTVIAAHGADPGRVFVAGLSAGGAMAAILGELYPERFAAIGVHSGLAAGSATDLPGAYAAMRGEASAPRATPPGPPARLPPTIVFHGDADPTAHPDNAERLVAACLDGARAEGATLRHERCIERMGPAGRGVRRDVYRDERDAVVVERWLLGGAGHAWSGGDPRGSYTDAAGPDATRAMLRFFMDVAGR